MKDGIYFQNDVHYMSVSPEGAIISQGDLRNVTGYFMRNNIMMMLTTPYGVSPGTVGCISNMAFRLDGNTILGSYAQYVSADNGTAYSTRYNSATWCNNVMFNATYTATANVTAKTIALILGSTWGGLVDMGLVVGFWSTLFNMSCGSGGKMIVQWNVSMP